MGNRGKRFARTSPEEIVDVKRGSAGDAPGVHESIHSSGVGFWESGASGDCHWLNDGPTQFDVDPIISHQYQRWVANIHPDDLDQYLKADNDAFQGRSDGYAVEYRIKTRTGHWRWLLERGTVTMRDTQGLATRFAGICFDISDFKRVKEALQAAQDRYSLTVNAAQLPVWEYDVPNDALQGNVFWHRTVGFDLPKQEAGTRVETWLSDVHPDDVARHRRVYLDPIADASGFFQNEFRVRLPDGRYKWLLDRGRVVERAPDGSPLRVLGISIDIDEHKRLEEALRESEARLATATAGGDIGLWDWNLGVVRWLSDWPQRKGIKSLSVNTSREDLVAAIHEDDRQRFLDDMRATMNGTAAKVAADYRILKFDGSTLWLHVHATVIERDADGSATRIVGSCSDVDERRRGEDALQEQAVILSTMHEGVALIDGNGCVQLTNPAFDQMLGADHRTLRGTAFNRYLQSPELRCLSVTDLFGRLRERQPLGSASCDVMLRRLDGTEFEAEIATRSMTFDGTQQWLAVVTDVSTRKHLEREVLQVVQREQHRVGQELHDGLGQELTGIALMLKGLAAKPWTDQALIRTQFNEVIELFNNAILSARAIAYGASPVEYAFGGLGHALGALVHQAQRASGIEIQLRTRLDDRLKIGATIADHLYRIAQEAINNALKHAQARHIVVSLIARSDRLSLSIDDDGIGVDDPAAMTFGLGLRIMSYRARMIDGEFRFARRRGPGMSVQVHCPLASAVPTDP